MWKNKSLFGFYLLGCTALLSPLALVLARRWVGQVAPAMLPHRALFSTRFGGVRLKSKIQTSSKYPVLWCRMAPLLFLLLPACRKAPDTGDKPGKLIVATAANVQFAMQELEEIYESAMKREIEVIISSSGKLTAQIRQGAPYHLFLSANMKYPRNLYADDYALDSPRVYAYGSLVAWTLRDRQLDSTLRFFVDPAVKKIAIANPRNAPYGRQAVNFLRRAGWYEQLQPKLVYGESIAQTNQYIISQACDFGLTAKSVVLSPEMRNRGRWVELPAEAYQPIEQGVIITRRGQQDDPEGCQQFYDFLFSEAARNTFKKYGYRLPPPELQ